MQKIMIETVRMRKVLLRMKENVMEMINRIKKVLSRLGKMLGRICKTQEKTKNPRSMQKSCWNRKTGNQFRKFMPTQYPNLMNPYRTFTTAPMTNRNRYHRRILK